MAWVPARPSCPRARPPLPSLHLPKSARFPTLSQALGTQLMTAIVLVGLELMAAGALLVAVSASSLRFLKFSRLAWGLL